MLQNRKQTTENDSKVPVCAEAESEEKASAEIGQFTFDEEPVVKSPEKHENNNIDTSLKAIDTMEHDEVDS